MLVLCIAMCLQHQICLFYTKAYLNWGCYLVCALSFTASLSLPVVTPFLLSANPPKQNRKQPKILHWFYSINGFLNVLFLLSICFLYCICSLVYRSKEQYFMGELLPSLKRLVDWTDSHVLPSLVQTSIHFRSQCCHLVWNPKGGRSRHPFSRT